LSVYDKIWDANVAFQFSFCPIREGWFQIYDKQENELASSKKYR